MLNPCLKSGARFLTILSSDPSLRRWNRPGNNPRTPSGSRTGSGPARRACYRSRTSSRTLPLRVSSCPFPSETGWWSDQHCKQKRANGGATYNWSRFWIFSSKLFQSHSHSKFQILPVVALTSNGQWAIKMKTNRSLNSFYPTAVCAINALITE